MHYPNHDPKPAGSFVENVHPCDTSTDGALVLGTCEIGDALYISVKTGRGSTAYGPAENWRPTGRRPDWDVRLELEQTPGTPEHARAAYLAEILERNNNRNRSAAA